MCRIVCGCGIAEHVADDDVVVDRIDVLIGPIRISHHIQQAPRYVRMGPNRVVKVMGEKGTVIECMGHVPVITVDTKLAVPVNHNIREIGRLLVELLADHQDDQKVVQQQMA